MTGKLVPAFVLATLAEAPGDRFLRVLLLEDPNTRVVLLGTALLGVMAGVVGVFMLLRGQALVGDVVGHATLPGIAGGFLVAELLSPGTGKSLPVLLTGAFATGLLGALCVLLIDRFSRIKSDAALAIVLSVFYGCGTVLLSVVQGMSSGASAGLSGYLNGRTASLLAGDVWLFAGATVVILAVTLLLFKELTLLCFDAEFAGACGWPVLALDGLLIMLVAAVTIIGMQSVGILLVVATLITPAAAARFWTDDIRRMAAVSGGLGAGSAVIGIALSAAIERVAAGATIVLVSGLLFGISLLLGRKRGIVWKRWEHGRLERQIARDDLLRAVYEQLEGHAADARSSPEVALSAVQASRRWTPRQLQRLIAWAVGAGLAARVGSGGIRLTAAGVASSRRLARNHRLWELYLIRYADIAAAHVDHTADLIEHVVDAETMAELERMLEARDDLPESPHVLQAKPG